nr:AMP-binding protein [uncultured Caldimonas sp.]
MAKIWLDAYPPGVPADINPKAYESLAAMAEESCLRFRDRPAFTSMGVTLTYGEFDELSRHFAAYLQRVLRLNKGDRIAVMLPNTLQSAVVVFGALRAGLTVVNVNPMYTDRELAFQLKNSGALAIVVLENFAHTLADALPATDVRHVVVSQLGDLFPIAKRWAVDFVVRHVKGLIKPWSIPQAVPLPDALEQGSRHRLEPTGLGLADTAFLQYTGGTTGRPKGAVLSHGNLVANVEQTTAWIAGVLEPGKETVITALPLYHVFALTANLLTFVKLGGHNVLIPDPRDLKHFVATLKKTRFSVITGVNTLFRALLDAPGFDQVCEANRGALKVAVAGGMAVQRVVAERWQQAVGVPIIEGYGLTETSPIVCANPLGRPFSGMLGLPVPSTDVAILDETGQPLPVGSAGEICVRGPQVMQGYWQAPEETDRVMTSDGWLRTGDIGRLHETGFVEFVDRAKDVVVVSGFKAFPTEIEDTVAMHPGVKDVGAVGMPDDRTGEAVWLFVVRRDPALTEEQLREHCASHLAAYKQPRRIVFCDDLPKTPIGKVLRRQLKAQALENMPAHAA